MTTLRLPVADNYALVRAGMLALLGQIPGVTVVDETGNGREALRPRPKHGTSGIP
jgi:DNA-binding NarL/FixJ family response regulator